MIEKAEGAMELVVSKMWDHFSPIPRLCTSEISAEQRAVTYKPKTRASASAVSDQTLGLVPPPLRVQELLCALLAGIRSVVHSQ